MMTENQKRLAAQSAQVTQQLIKDGTLTRKKTIASQGNVTDYSKVAKDSIPTSNKKRTYTNETPLVQSKANAKTTRTPSVAVVDEKKLEAQFVLPEETPIEDMKTTVLAPPVVEPILPKIEVQTMAQQKKTESQPAKKAVVKKVETVIPPSLLDVWQALELVEKEKQIENPLVHGARAFSEIEYVEQQWLSKRLNMPDNALCIFNGLSGIGKTTWLLDVAAHLSSGTSWSWGEECMEGNVILCMPEDNAASTLLPRLEATGCANLENIIDFSYVEKKQEGELHPSIKVPFMLPDRFAELSALIKQKNPALVIIDNVVRCFQNPFSPSFVTSHILNVLTEMAQLQNVCIIVVNHVYDTAKKGGKAKTKGASTIESAARVNWLATPDASNPDWIVISNSNINIAKHMEPLRYTRKTVVENVQNEESGVWEEKERTFIAYYEGQVNELPEKQEETLKSKILMKLFEQYIDSIENNVVDRGIARHVMIQRLNNLHSTDAIAACFKRLVTQGFIEKTGVGWYKLSDSLKNDMLQVSACKRQVAALGIDIDAIPRLNVASLKQISASATAK